MFITVFGIVVLILAFMRTEVIHTYTQIIYMRYKFVRTCITMMFN
jgi:hypothetical protein